MSVTITPRLGVYRWSADADPDNRNQFDTSHAQLEALCAIYGTGLHAALAALIAGRVLRATDTGAVFWDDGAVLHTLVGQAMFGDGSDGTVTLATNTTLTRDMYYDNLTVPVGVTLSTAGFRVFVRRLLTHNGTISAAGVAAAGATAGINNGSAGNVGALSGTLGIGANGSNGGTGIGSVPSAFSGNTQCLGGQGGAGGAGTPNAGGANGGLTGTGPGVMGGGPSPRDLDFLTSGLMRVRSTTFTTSTTSLAVMGGTGGASGGGDGTNAGGAGGAGGNVLGVYARHIVGTGTLTVHGGNGGNGASGNTGGGGGGGGGLILCVTLNPTMPLTLDVAGGLGGAKSGTGVNGTAGAPGTSLVLLGAV